MAQNVVLSEERKGQIALIILKDEFSRREHPLSKAHVKRRIGQGAEQLKDKGVTKEELIELYKEFVEEAVKELF